MPKAVWALWISVLVGMQVHAWPGWHGQRVASSVPAASPHGSEPLAVGNCAWTDVPSPNTGSPHNTLTGVAAIAQNDVWAVGAYGVFGLDPQQVIQHWDGQDWSIATTPSLGVPSQLTAISAVHANDIWAVGGYDSGGQSLVERWNGVSWSVVSHPNPGLFNRFFGVAAVSSQDVWAVGQTNDGGLAQTLVERWNGSSWSIVPTPSVPNQHNQLNAVAAVPGSAEVWAVGSAGPTALLLHWNGAQWSLVPAPDAGINPILNGVVALSANDIWAVGYTSTGSGPVTLTLHWNGLAWSVVRSPNPGPTFNYLWGVGAVGPNNVWAVGEYIAPGGKGTTLILRWNGTAWTHVPGDDTGPKGLGFSLKAVSGINGSTVWAVGTNSHSLVERWNGANWSIVPSPNSGVGDNLLNGVSGTLASDVWTVGYFVFGTEHRTLIQHWDGAGWEIVRSPNTNKRLNELRGVVALSTSDAWAVGTAHSGSAPDQTTLILRWDGMDWGIVPSPSPGIGGLNELNAVDATAPNNVWAVGAYSHGGLSQTLIERWNGSSWNVLPSPNVPGVNNGLYGVTALAPDDVWAVGYFGNFTFSPLVLHWDGSTWSVVSSSDPQTSSNILRAVSDSSPSDLWAVGTAKNSLTNMTSTLTEHWDGSEWSLVPGTSGSFSSTLFGTAAASPADAWQVGDSDGLALIGRWNGNAWTKFPSPPVTGRLHAATVIPSGDVWTVGFRYVEDVGFLSLTEHFACEIDLYCFCGTGGGCANPDPSSGCANSTGAGASLFHSTGSTSVTADDLVLGTAQLPPSKLGIYFMGGAPANSPFFDGRLCVAAGASGLFRYPVQSSGTTGNMTLGPGIVAHSQTFSLAGRIQAGNTWFFQAWYRDPNGPCGAGANLTNAARITFQP